MKKNVSRILLCTALSACSASLQHSHSGQLTHTAKSESIASLESGLINPKALVEPPVNTPCTLEDGSSSECLKVVIKYLPDDQPIGPFCPKTIDDVGGIWNWDGDNPGLYRVDRDFLEMLAAQGFTFYEQDGAVHIADISVAGPAHDHACINVSEDEDVQITLLIPLTPSLADASTRLGIVSKVGLALDGAPIFSGAPSVQHTGHMPALDTCGGHVDPGGWYHFHATASDLDSVYKRENVEAKCALAQNPSALFGFAFDGFPIYGAVEQDGSKPAGLDSCGGHSFNASTRDAKLYHYHASESFPNLPKCLSGVSARNNFATTAQAGIGAMQRSGQSTRREPPGAQAGPRGPRGQGGMPPGFEDTAAKLDVTAEQLLNAMEAAGGPNADLSVVAKTLGVEVAALQSALRQRQTNR